MACTIAVGVLINITARNVIQTRIHSHHSLARYHYLDLPESVTAVSEPCARTSNYIRQVNGVHWRDIL